VVRYDAGPALIAPGPAHRRHRSRRIVSLPAQGRCERQTDRQTDVPSGRCRRLIYSDRTHTHTLRDCCAEPASAEMPNDRIKDYTASSGDSRRTQRCSTSLKFERSLTCHSRKDQTILVLIYRGGSVILFCVVMKFYIHFGKSAEFLYRSNSSAFCRS